ncbi:DMT family transporter [Salinarimonas soli]|uniref:EamA family transporter n=1 Tax=Salinarimonas soli TaxID=1638099 RepID=A0A5B2VCG2_9HYPH|nr:EamA family transporter [Salinarimonas soli]KAA2235807.1 EamA family transporter [Salinarimonas soli]
MRSHVDRRTLLFALMCLIWGATWVAAKVGLASVPPVLFSGTRFLAAGGIILLWCRMRGESTAVAPAHRGRLALAMLLMVALTYPLLFWGTIHVSSGLAAVIDLSFLPVALLGFAVLAGEERFSRRKGLAIGLGALGLAVLFGPKASTPGTGSPLEAWGVGAIILSALVYAGGSVIARPLLRVYPPLVVAGVTLFWGGVVTTLAALAAEPGALAALPHRWPAMAWGAWLFLVAGGSLAAYTIYLVLVRDWGPSRAGAYCYVSPAIAVGLGVVLLGERIAVHEGVGMATMLAAAWLAVRPGREEADA